MSQADRVRAAFYGSLRLPDKKDIVEWAEANVYLSERFSDIAGPLDLSITPWVKDILRWFVDPEIEMIVLCFAAQTSKTLTEMLCLGYAAAEDPGPSLFVQPNESMAKRFSRNRVRPFLEDSKELRKLLPDRREDLAKLEMVLKTMTLTLVGSNSPANLASIPIRYLFIDEADKCALASSREASAVPLAIKRTRTFDRRKIMLTSTPTVEDGEIWQHLQSTDWRKYFVPCPRCQHKQPMEWKNFWWPPECRRKDGTWDTDRVEKETRYVCTKCKAKIENWEKNAMVARGEWIATKTGSPRIVGAQLPAFVAPWSSCDWGRLAVEWLKAQPYPDKLQDFINSTGAEPWVIRGKALDSPRILSNRGKYMPGTCPIQPIHVTLTTDVQEQCLYYTIRAWGPHETSYLIRYGMVETFAALLEIRAAVYTGPNGGPLQVTRSFIDSGDRTDEVYRFCARHRFLPWKGEDSYQQSAPFRLSKLPTGQVLLLIKTDLFKTALQTKLQIPLEDPGAWHLHSETGGDYAAHLTAEELVDEVDSRGFTRRRWVKKKPDNHYLDCEVAQLAVAQLLGVRFATGEAAPVRSISQEAAADGSNAKRFALRRVKPRGLGSRRF